MDNPTPTPRQREARAPDMPGACQQRMRRFVEKCELEERTSLLLGIIQYPPTGIARVIAPFILSLWFPGSALLILGLVYWFLSTRKT